MSNGNQTAPARRTASVITYNSMTTGERIFVPGTLRLENTDITEFVLSDGSTEISVQAVEAKSNRPAGFMLSTDSINRAAIITLLERLFPRTVVDQIMTHYGTFKVIAIETRHITTANRQLNITAAKSRNTTPAAFRFGSTVTRQQQSTAALRQLADPAGRIPAKRFHTGRQLVPSHMLINA